MSSSARIMSLQNSTSSSHRYLHQDIESTLTREDLSIENKGSRVITVGVPDRTLPSNRIESIRPFCKLLPLILLRIMTKPYILYLIAPGVLNCIVVQEQYLPLNIFLVALLLAIYILKVAFTLKRFSSYDRIENIEPVTVWDNGEWMATTWERLQVGNVIRVKAGEDFPADVLPIYCKGEDKVAVSTYRIDKEQKTVEKKISQKFSAVIKTEARLRNLQDFRIIYEKPNKYYYNFEGKVVTPNVSYEDFPDEIIGYEEHLILRGSVNREQSETICVVVYTGNECKIFSHLNSHRTYTNLTILQRQWTREVPYITAITLVLTIFNIIVYIIQYSTKLKRRDPQHQHISNKFFYYEIMLQIMAYMNIMHVSIFLFLELVRFLQMKRLESKITLKRNNLTQGLDQFGRAHMIVTDQTTLFGQQKLEYKEVILPPECWIQIQTIKKILVSSSIVREFYRLEVQSIQQELGQVGSLRGTNFTIQSQMRSRDSKKLFIFVKLFQGGTQFYYLLSIGHTHQIYSNLDSTQFTRIQEASRKIKLHKDKGARILAVSSRKLDDNRYKKIFEQPIKQSESMLANSIRKYDDKMRFECGLVFEYAVNQEVREFVEEVRKADIRFWIVTEKNLQAIDQLLTSTRIQNAETDKYIVDQEGFNQLNDHLSYVLGVLNKKNVKKQSILYISCDSLNHLQKQHIISQIRQISKKCFTVVCFQSGNFQREKLLKCFGNTNSGVLFFSQFILECNVMQSADVSVSIEDFYSARVTDWEVRSVVDLGKLLSSYGSAAYRRNCQMIYCLVFANTFLVGCQIFILFVGLWWTPYILEYLYEIDFFNLLFISLPLVYYTSNIEGGLGKQTVYSSWAVWRIIAVALLIGILVAAVNFAWIIRDTRIFDLSMATYTGGIVAGNAFIGITILYEPNITKCVRIVSLILLALEIGLYSISLLIENNVNRLNQYVTVAILIKNKYFLMPCLLICTLMTVLLIFTYLTLWPLCNQTIDDIDKNQQKPSKQVKCRLTRTVKGRTIKLVQ